MDNKKLRLQVIICSTRPGRAGAAIGKWFYDAACAATSDFDIELVDLKDIGLPLFDEAMHPRLGKYQHDHTWRWSATVSAANAFVFVTPEYNYAPPPSLLNALDCLSAEWAYKPVGFVSYGGIAGGTRSVQVTKQVVTTLRMVPLTEAVVIPNFMGQLKPETGFTPNPMQIDSVGPLLLEAQKLAQVLRPLQAPALQRPAAA